MNELEVNKSLNGSNVVLDPEASLKWHQHCFVIIFGLSKSFDSTGLAK